VNAAKQVERADQAVSASIILLIAGPIVLGVSLALIFNAESVIGIWHETLTTARVSSLLTISERSGAIAALGVLFGTPVGVWLARNQTRIRAAVVATGLIAPFFVNDAIKAYAWADFLRHIAHIVSPYSNVGRVVPLVLSTIPIVGSIVAIEYSSGVRTQEMFAHEIAARRMRPLLFVTIPLLGPYLVCAWFLAFGFVF
jgi:ABC-type spermidine/putrescine transport system permease subunit I